MTQQAIERATGAGIGTAAGIEVPAILGGDAVPPSVMAGAGSTTPITRHVTCSHADGLHLMAYHEWAPAQPVAAGAGRALPGAGRTLVCVHALSRNGRDFDTLAARLARLGFRVICPDLPGRGRSEPLPQSSYYNVPQYVADCAVLIARLDVERVDWIGTSLGGLVGMVLAGMRGSPIARLVVNDIGPCIEAAGLERIRRIFGQRRVHPDFASAERALREALRTFGPHDDAAFRKLSAHHFVPAPGGGLVAHYDPAIARSVTLSGTPPPFWDGWERIDVPVLALRGERSDILSEATFARMQRAAKVTGVQIEGVGHAPTLIADDQIACVTGWLAASLPLGPAQRVCSST